MKNLYILRKLKNEIKKKIDLEIYKYKEFILSERTLSSIKELPNIGIKNIVIDGNLQKEGNIYKIDESDRKKDFVIMSGDYILPFSIEEKKTVKNLDEKTKKELKEKYFKYKPFSKKEILEKIYNEANQNGTKILTKKFLNENSIDTIAEKLSYHKINTLENFMMFYDVVKSKTLKIKNRDDSTILSNSQYFHELSTIEEKKLSVLEKTHAMKEILNKIEREIEQIEEKINLDKLPDGSEDFFTIVEKEELVFIKETPNDKDISSIFMKKEFNESKYRLAIENGEENRYTVDVSATISKPCKGINELLLNKTLEKFAKQYRHEMKDFKTNDRIQMIA